MNLLEVKLGVCIWCARIKYEDHSSDNHCLTMDSMDAHGWRWITIEIMEIHVYPLLRWVPIEFHVNPWVSLGYPLVSMDTPMNIDGYPWRSSVCMDIHEYPCGSPCMDFHVFHALRVFVGLFTASLILLVSFRSCSRLTLGRIWWRYFVALFCCHNVRKTKKESQSNLP